MASRYPGNVRPVRFAAYLLALLLMVVFPATAQQVITVNGIDYESITWPASGGPAASSIGSWVNNGGGSIEVNAGFFLRSEVGPIDFTDPIFTAAGISLNGVTFFAPNMGQHNGKEDLPPGEQTITNTYTLTSPNLPTEIFFVLGADDDNGFKYTVHDWASSQPDTMFELVGSYPTIRDVTGGGTANLQFRNYDADGTTGNNKAKVLVRIGNSAGISNFSTTSNRVGNDGSVIDKPPGAQSVDFSNTTILVRVTPAPGSIEVNKVVDGDVSNAADWTFHLGASGAMGCDISDVTTSLTIPAAGGVGSFDGLPVVNTETGADCTYFVEEVTQAGWEVQEPNPRQGLELTAGSVTVVAFTNVEQVEPPIIVPPIVKPPVDARPVPVLGGWSMTLLALFMLGLANSGLGRYAGR